MCYNGYNSEEKNEVRELLHRKTETDHYSLYLLIKALNKFTLLFAAVHSEQYVVYAL